MLEESSKIQVTEKQPYNNPIADTTELCYSSGYSIELAGAYIALHMGHAYMHNAAVV